MQRRHLRHHAQMSSKSEPTSPPRKPASKLTDDQEFAITRIHEQLVPLQNLTSKLSKLIDTTLCKRIPDDGRLEA
jgi:hypothetical protein